MAETSVTGYQLQTAVKEAKNLIEFASKQFEDSQMYFDSDETKINPHETFNVLEKAEKTLAALKSAQAQYNLRQRVTFDNKEITLHEAINLIGVYGKFENLWKKATKDQRESYLGRQTTKATDQEYAKRAIDPHAAMEAAVAFGRKTAELKGGINAANLIAVSLDIPVGLLG